MKFTDHYFRIEIATRFGVDVAIFVNDIYHWCDKNQNNQACFHKGRYWTFNKMSAFCERHPYWSRRQVERIIAASKDAGLILVDRFNKDPMVRTNWYAVSDFALSFYERTEENNGGKCKTPDGEIESHNSVECNHDSVDCIYEENIEKENIELKSTHNPSKRGGGRRERSQAKYLPELFNEFWDKEYPRHDNRIAAIRAWDKLRPDQNTYQQMLSGLERDKQSRQWQKDCGDYIPHCSTWLNQRAWENEGVDMSLLQPDPPESGGYWAPDPEVTT